MFKTIKSPPIIISIGMIILSFYIIYNYHDEESLMNEISVSGKKVAKEAPSSFVATNFDYQTKPVPSNSILMGYLIDG